MKKNLVLFGLLIALVFPKTWADDQEEVFPPVPLSDHHKILHQGVGEWDVVQKTWMSADAEPVVAKGTSVCRKILQGQGTMVEVETKDEHGVFRGFGIFTWSTIKKQYEASWLDVYSYNGIDSMTGTYDKKSQTLTWTSQISMPSGVKIPFKMVEEKVSNDKAVSRFYMPDESGKEFMVMENVYTRKVSGGEE